MTAIETPARTESVRLVTQALLRELGMTTIFGNPGSTELRFLKDWPADFRYVMALHEGPALAMADAYAQLTGNAAIVQLHSAGGLGNAMGTLFTAYRNNAPLVILAGQQTRAMLHTEPFLFASDPTTMPLPYVKWAVEPVRPEDVPGAIARAYRIAMERPYGPTFVSVPEDDWDRETVPLEARRVYGDVVADASAIAALVDAFARSRAPALVVGSGVDRDGASELAVRLAERTGAAVYAAALSSRCGFPEDHPLFAGALPRMRSAVVDTLAERDLVVVLGASVFNYHVHAEGPYIKPGTAVFQLTDDPAVASSAVVGTSIITTLGPALESVLAALPQRAPAPLPPRMFPQIPASDPITIEYLLQALRTVLPDDAIIAEETPAIHSILHDVGLLRPGRFLSAASGSLGYGLPAAIGAAVARPGQPIVALIGDGSSYYGIQAIWTAVEHRLPIAFVIVNNGGYGAMKAFTQIMRSERSPSFDIGGVDFVALAAGFGAQGRRIERASDLAGALETAIAAREPFLLDVAVDTAIRAIR
jgi:benzoylformate decarboxylase